MKLKSLVLAIAVVLGGVFAGGSVYAAGSGSGSASSATTGVTCPAGSLRGDAGQPANTYAECNLPVDTGPSLMNRVQTIINVIVGVIGVVAVAVIIIGGVFYVTSTGEAAKIARAKNTILYGIVGLVIAMLAFAIVNFVMSSVFK